MERNELLRSSFITKIGESYSPEQLIFLDESAMDVIFYKPYIFAVALETKGRLGFSRKLES